METNSEDVLADVDIDNINKETNYYVNHDICDDGVDPVSDVINEYEIVAVSETKQTCSDDDDCADVQNSVEPVEPDEEKSDNQINSQPLNLSVPHDVDEDSNNDAVQPQDCTYRNEECCDDHEAGQNYLYDAQRKPPGHCETLRDMSQYLLQVPPGQTSALLQAQELARGNTERVGEEDCDDPDFDADDNDDQPQEGDAERDANDASVMNDVNAMNSFNIDGMCFSGVNSEVLRLARALFSKRTRTLYHWMYPDTPKMQLKQVVANAWDAMLVAEKQFYVSQVLGKFGCLQSQLMVNPQLGNMATVTSPSSMPQIPTQSYSSPPVEAMVPERGVTEDQIAQAAQQAQIAHAQAQHEAQINHSPLSQSQRVYIEEIIPHSRHHYTHINHYAHAHSHGHAHPHAHYSLGYDLRAGPHMAMPMPPVPIRRRRGRPRGSSQAAVLQSLYVQRLHAVKRLSEARLAGQHRRHHRRRRLEDYEMNLPMPLPTGAGVDNVGMPSPPRVHNNPSVSSSSLSPAIGDNEFDDDPELRNEFEKFQWTLHMVE